MRLARCLSPLEKKVKPSRGLDSAFHVSWVVVVDLSCASRVFSGHSGFPPSQKSTHLGHICKSRNVCNCVCDIELNCRTL